MSKRKPYQKPPMTEALRQWAKLHDMPLLNYGDEKHIEEYKRKKKARDKAGHKR